MNLLTLIIVLVVVGVALYLINGYIPMDPRIKKLLNIVAIIFIIFWLVKAFGVWDYLSRISL